jgi:hypothetical protein
MQGIKYLVFIYYVFTETISPVNTKDYLDKENSAQIYFWVTFSKPFLIINIVEVQCRLNFACEKIGFTKIFQF